MQKITNYFKAHTCLNNLVAVFVKESWCWEAEETEAHRSRIAKNSIDWEFIDGHVMPGVMVSWISALWDRRQARRLVRIKVISSPLGCTWVVLVQRPGMSSVPRCSGKASHAELESGLAFIVWWWKPVGKTKSGYSGGNSGWIHHVKLNP